MRKKVILEEPYHKVHDARVKLFIKRLRGFTQTDAYNRLIEKGFVTLESYPIASFRSDVRNADVSGTGLLIKPEILSAVLSVMGMSADTVFGKAITETTVIARLDVDSLHTVYKFIEAELKKKPAKESAKEPTKEPRKVRYDIMGHAQYVVSCVSQICSWQRWDNAIFGLFINYSLHNSQIYKHASKKTTKIDFILDELLTSFPVTDYETIQFTQNNLMHTLPNFNGFCRFSVWLVLCYQFFTLFNIMDVFFKGTKFQYIEKGDKKINFGGLEFEKVYSIDCTAEQKQKLQAHIAKLKKIDNEFFTKANLPVLTDSMVQHIFKIILIFQEIFYFFLGVRSTTNVQMETHLSNLRRFLKKPQKVSSVVNFKLSDDILEKFDLLEKLFADMEFPSLGYKPPVAVAELPPPINPSPPSPDATVNKERTDAIKSFTEMFSDSDEVTVQIPENDVIAGHETGEVVRISISPSKKKK